MESDRDYYERRFREELALAERAEKVEVRFAHRLLATIYADRVDGLGSAEVKDDELRKAFRWK